MSRKPQPKSWNRQFTIDWLLAHPIDWNDEGISDAALDVEFVRDEIARRAAAMMSAIQELEDERDALEGCVWKRSFEHAMRTTMYCSCLFFRGALI